MNQSGYTTVAFALFCVLFVLGCLSGTLMRPLWYDEFYTLQFAFHGPDGGLYWEGIRADTYPPVFTVLVRWYGFLTGLTDEYLRFLNLFGLLVFIPIFFLTRRLLTTDASFLFWSLTLTSFGLMYHFADLRAYFLASCFGGWLFVAAAAYLVQKISFRTFLLHGVPAVLALSVLHYFSFLFAGGIILSLFIHALVYRKYREALVLFVFGGVVFVAEMAWLIYTLENIGHYFTDPVPYYWNIWRYLEFTEMVFGWNVVLIAILLFLLIKDQGKFLVGQGYLILPVVVVLLFPLILTLYSPHFSARYLTVTIIPIYFMIALFLQPMLRPQFLAVLILTILVAGLHSVWRQHETLENLDHVAKTVLERKQCEGDVVVTHWPRDRFVFQVTGDENRFKFVSDEQAQINLDNNKCPLIGAFFHTRYDLNDIHKLFERLGVASIQTDYAPGCDDPHCGVLVYRKASGS